MTSSFFTTKSNQKIFYRQWKPRSEAKALVMIIHGLGEHSGRYEYQAGYLMNSGFEVYAFDNIGHGLSEGKRGFVNSFGDYLELLDQFISLASTGTGEKPLFLLGHSLGGLIAASYASRLKGSKISGLILSSPSVALNKNIEPNIFERFLLKAASVITPALTLDNRIDPHLLSRDKAVVENYIKDPLVFKRITPRLFIEMRHTQRRLLTRAGSITMPCLTLGGEEDKITPPESISKFHSLIASKNKALKIYKGLYHEILNEPEKEVVLSDVVAFLLDFGVALG